MPIVSIIIPVYNVEKYILKCLDSIYTQGVDENIFEVIAVIDGSPDDCSSLIKEYSKNHSNLIIIEKENGGVSSARNMGISYAQGIYLMFVDSDDCLFPASLRRVIDSIKNDSSEIIICRSFKGTLDKEVYSWKDKMVAKLPYTGFEVFENWGLRGSVCGVIFNSYFWKKNRIEFPLGLKNSEDSIVSMLCFQKAKVIKFEDIKLYNVLVRHDSASNMITPQVLETWFSSLDFLRMVKNSSQNRLENGMCDSLIYSIISNITKHAIRIWGFSAINFLHNNKVKTYLPISEYSIKQSSLLNRGLKRILNSSFFSFFLISYFRVRILRF